MIGLNTLISHIKSRTRRRSTLLGGTLALTLGVSTFAWNVHAIERASNKTQIKFLDLTPEAKPTENMIRLDWNKLDEHTYQVYQKREGENEFQSVSMTDLSKTKQVKVLNLYPTVEDYTGVIYDTAYTTWDGESIPTLPKSASLKRWMEEPNHEHSKGYGRGLIEVTPVSLQEFNKTPLTYLKNTDGTWKYDVVVIGSWDNNGLNDDITKDGRNLLIEFLDSNRGILFGHDTIRGRDTGVDLSPYLNSLHEYIKLEVNDIDFSKIKWRRSTTVEVSKKGLLTNYPWMIGDVGETMTIPESHTVDQLPGGDVWVKFKGKTAYDEYNYYLTTWNNAAMIQTGHSNGEVTSDEQKILANTLFYLNQLSDVNYLNDHSGQDVKAPDKPIIKSTKALSNGYVEVTFNTLMDQGSSYEYYVKATHKNGNSSTISDIKTETITSGVAGVSYVIDTHSTTEPDNTIDALSNNKLSVKANSEKNTYIHIKTIDHAGNVSETQHFTISAPPALRSEVVDNQYVRLDWATEILPENMIYQTGFEPGDDINPTAYLGGMSISENNCHQGNQCLLMQNASTQGNNGGNDGSTTNRYDFNPVYGLDVNMKFSASLWVKNIGEETDSDLFIGARGGVPKTSEPFHVKYGLSNPIIVAEDTSKTPNLIKIKDFNTFSNSLKNDFIYSASTAISTNYEGEWLPFNKTSGLVPSQEGIYVPDHLSANYKKGDILHSTDYVYPLVLSGPTTPANGEWTLYNFNGDILDYDYDTALRGLIPFINSYSDGGMYIDDIRFGHATKVKLYRNNQVIYEGYDAKLDDYSATDKEKPNMVDADSVIASFSNNQANINFNQATDNGSSYTYYVEPLDKNNNAGLPSDKKTEVITSGIAGYSFVIDQNKTTSPDAIIDTTSTTIQHSLIGNKDYYLHIRTIDKNGNISDTAHIKLEGLKLTAEAKPSKNMIRLDWTAVKDSLYQVYQKKESSNKFESIGRSLETVKVLNVYPTSWEYSTFTTWDGETLTLPVGGMLKKWMEEPNAEHPKGYGQGLIEVTPVDFTSFNQNPTSYLKQNSDGSWNYDVVMVGSYDCNGDCNSYSTMNFSASTEQFVSEFISQGYGVLLGHDFRSLTNKVETEGIPAVEPVGSSLVKLSKKGILTNFPWNLGEIGTILNIPYAHNSGPYVEDSDIWIKFEGNNDPNYCYYGHYNWCRPDQFWYSSTNNHYLAIKNNVAMIQTGHSGGSSTPDEQKIIANTLFFLKQISDQNYLNDYSGQDVKAPNKPVSKSTEALSDGFVEITFDTLTDQGSTYEYYVKASHKNGNSAIASNIETETITSGIAGVSYIIDTNPDTEPDNQLDSFSNNKIKVKPNTDQTTYLHIKTVDKAGNVSETEHIMISIPKINTAEQRDETIYLNWDIEIPTSSVFWVEDFSSKYLDLPAGNLVTGIAFNANGHDVDHWGVTRPSNDIVRNGVKIIDGVGYNGGRGVVVSQTAPGNGWTYQVFAGSDLPVPSVDWSGTRFTDWQKLKTDRPAIARFLTKGEGEFRLNLAADWTGNGVNNEYGYTWAENLTADEFRTRLENLQPIKVNNPSGTQRGGFHLTTAFDYNYSFNFHLSIGDIIISNGQWYYLPTAWYGPWVDSVKPGQTITPAADRKVEPITIGKPLSQLQGTPAADNTIKISINDWTHYSMNLYLPTSQEIADLGDYFRLMTFFKSYSQMYIDEIQIAYAPKSRLYRNGQLILEDFTVEHTDQDVKDTTAPEKASVSTQYVNGKLKLTWQEVKDKGTIYTYEVSGVNENGQESLRSAPKEVEFTSGIKEYRIYLNGRLVETTTNPNYQFKTKLTSSDKVQIGVVDNAGNESKTEVKFLHLIAEAKPTQNMIRLDWNALNEHTYQAYQKKEDADEFHSISTMDFESEKVRVLNVYPDIANKTTSFYSWDGSYHSLPQSAILKQWMEEPNTEHPKGYGKGLITVDTVEISDFNNNPDYYLKNGTTSYQYDVVVFGISDSWGDSKSPALGGDAEVAIDQFLSTGRGVLFGHDTAYRMRSGTLSRVDSFTRLAEKYLNIQLYNLPSSELVLDNFYNGNNPSLTTSYSGTSTIEITKKGLLTNYPWSIGEVGTILTTPYTHTAFQKTGNGDIWMRFNWNNNGMDNAYNSYLYTYNNTALIQTGHSIAAASNASTIATADEQKVLANTIFYLKQLSANNFLNDYSGQDLKAPEKPSVSNARALSNGYVEVTLNDLIDYGSTYEYYVKAIHKSGSEQISNTVSETITTGIKGVSYVINTNPKTEPDNLVEPLTNQTIQVKPNQTQTTYLHIKTIDNAGNESETLHYEIGTLKLTAEAKPTENDGKGLVRLDWTNKTNHTYQVYQKKEGSNDFQSISTSDLSKTKQIQVLNIYPDICLVNSLNCPNDLRIPSDSSFTTWDGETFTLPQSAKLKRWMEEPNNEHPKGYGQGLIEVTPVSFTDFNINPESYLKNSDGSWKYNVVMIGTWDSNGPNADITKLGRDLLVEFLDSNRGVLFGHDTIRGLDYGTNLSPYLNSLKDYIKLTLNDIDFSQTRWHRSTTVEISKKGLLTNYPWRIGEIGDTLTIPESHTVDQLPGGDIWIKFRGKTSYDEYNYYLTTWNNAAMVQTGHSNGEATPDEQKILANTLFYLNQLSDVNYLNDYSGQDLKAPDKPSIKNHTYTTNGFISLAFDAVKDNGSLYEYYVKATHKDGNGVASSNIASATVTTGVKGYSWIADNNPDTVPDDIIEQSNYSNIKIPTNNRGPYYLHIKAVDQAGNVSETFHYELTDVDKPTLTLTQNPTDWTNQDVIITATATDHGKVTSGIKEIILPDRNKVAGSTATFTAIQNGTYTFEAVDFMGNRQTASITISNIDKIKPTGSIIIDQNQDEFYEEETEIHINMSDILDGQERLSGIAKVEIFDVNGTYSHTMTNPSSYQQTLPWVLVPYELPDGTLKAQIGMKLTDKAGNVVTIYSKEVTIIKLRIEEFYLTNVLNPGVYNNANPFVTLRYPNIPSQPLVTGGHFSFKVEYSYPRNADARWKIDYKEYVRYQKPDGSEEVYPTQRLKEQVNGELSSQVIIPYDLPLGTKVYLDFELILYNQNGRQIANAYFPQPENTSLLIGEIVDDIRSFLQFNEIA